MMTPAQTGEKATMETTLKPSADGFLLVDATGKAKVSCRCSGCKTSWYEFHEIEKYEHRHRYAGQLGLEHVQICPILQARIAERVKRWNRTVASETDQVRILNINGKLFRWNDRGDGGHECSEKCQSATGPSCECRCQGKNHGGS